MKLVDEIIMDMKQYFVELESFGDEKIEEIKNSDLEDETKRTVIHLLEHDRDKHVKSQRHRFEVIDAVDDTIKDELNYLTTLPEHDWLNKQAMRDILRAYLDIQLFYIFLKKHNIGEKYFLRNKEEIIKAYDLLYKFTSFDPIVTNLDIYIPEHPQDILFKLTNVFKKHNVAEKQIDTIVSTISDYERLPKKPIRFDELKEIEIQPNTIRSKFKS